MTPVGSIDLVAAIIEFERNLSAFGLVLPPGGVVADGVIHRIRDAQHHRRRNNDGWYVLHLLRSGLVTGWYGSWWRDRGTKGWSSRNQKTVTKADRVAIAEQRAKIEADCLRRYQEGTKRAARMWVAAKACNSHPYLGRKRVQSYGLRVLDEATARYLGVQDVVGEMLLIPVKDLDGNLHGLQLIGPADIKDNKKYTTGTDRSSETCFVIGTLDDAATAAIVEGYATGATIHEATGWPVVVAFDAGGVEKIAKPLRQRLPKATPIFAGDNDTEEKGCRGQKAARKAARLAGGVVALPPTEGDDWNDHAAKYGLDDVRARLVAAAGMMDLPPTVTLDEGQTQIKQNITQFFKQAMAWRALPEDQRNVATPPAWLVNGTMGSGKSRIARRAAGQFLMENPGAAVVTSVPLHRLANEQAGLFAEETSHQALIWRGMDQPDPERRDGSKMCLEPDLSKAAQDAGLHVTSVCKLCPSRNDCGYRMQKKLSGRAWYMPHQLLYHPKPKPIPAPSVLIVDEAFHGPGLAQNVPLAASALEGDLLDVLHRGDRDLLSAARGALLSAFRRAEAEPQASKTRRVSLTKAMVEAAGLDADTVRDARRIEWSRKPNIPIEGSVAEMVRELRAVAHRFTPKVPRLWGLVEDLLRGEHETSTHIEIEPNARLQGGDGCGTMVWLHYRLDIHPSWRAPTLLLDGTGRPELVRLFFPTLHIAPEIHIEAPHQRVAWIRHSFAKARFVPSNGAEERRNKARQNNVEYLGRFIETKAAQYHGRGVGPYDVLIVTNLGIETQLRSGQELPSNVTIEHFNNLRGTDTYGGVRTVIVVGRPLPDAQTIHRQAERLAGHQLDQTDPLVEAVRWSICEAELLQVIARARGIRRTEQNPLDVFLLGDTPLPVAIDRTVSWDEAQPHPLELLAARGLVPDCDTDTKGYWPVVTAMMPDMFGTPDAARVAFARSCEQTSMSNISIDKCSRERGRTTGQDVNFTAGQSSLADNLSREQMSMSNWQSFEAKPHGGRYSIPVLVDPARHRDLEIILELIEPEMPTSQTAVDVPQVRERQAPPACDPIFKPTLDPAYFPSPWQAWDGLPGRFEGDDSLTACCVPVALPEALGSVEEVVECLVEAHPSPVPMSLDGDPSPDPLMDEAVTWLSDQITLGGIPPFESLEPVDPTLSVEETVRKRMRAEWRDSLAWHRARHDLASDVAARP